LGGRPASEPEKWDSGISGMIFGGLQKSTLIDYPARIASVFFTSGCNFDCPYCHNPKLASGSIPGADLFDEKQAYAFLKRRKGFIDGVVISGGEPTLQKGLAAVCRSIKQMGFPVKIDTNGSRPKVIAQLIGDGLVDYLAMDVKTGPDEYSLLHENSCQPQDILASIRLIIDSGIAHEFKTTCVRPLVDETVIAIIARIIRGAERYALQQFRNTGVLHPEFFTAHPEQYDETDLLRFQAVAQPYVRECLVR
jgi:pyruvate formate lyase activating enzyme